jgi:type I restriction enzyme S subunit
MRNRPELGDPEIRQYSGQARVLALGSEVDRLRNVGAIFSSLNVRDIARIHIPLLPMTAQMAIAEVLGALDDKIAANSALSASTEAVAFALVAGAHEMLPLGHVVTHTKVQADPAALTAAEVAHFSLPAFDAGRIAEIVPPLEIKSSKFAVERPSVLISKLNPRFPRVWDLAAVPAIPALASTEFLVLEPRFSSTTFLWALLLQPSFGSSLESKVSGTSGSHQRVRPDDLLATPIADPRGFGDDVKTLVTSLGLRAAQARDESVALAATRDTLLPALMSGRLRVRDAERIVSASV